MAKLNRAEQRTLINHIAAQGRNVAMPEFVHRATYSHTIRAAAYFVLGRLAARHINADRELYIDDICCDQQYKRWLTPYVLDWANRLLASADDITIRDAVFCAGCGQLTHVDTSSEIITNGGATADETWEGVDVCSECLRDYVYSEYSELYIQHRNALHVYDAQTGNDFFIHSSLLDDLIVYFEHREVDTSPGHEFDVIIRGRSSKQNWDEDGWVYVYDYHAGPRNFPAIINCGVDYPPLGLEIELDFPRRKINKILREFNTRVEKIWFVVERDGSLNDETGIELIFQPLDPIAIRRSLLPAIEYLRESGVRGYLKEYGIHINVQPRGLSDRQIARLCDAFESAENADIIRVLANRWHAYEWNFGIPRTAGLKIKERFKSARRNKYSPIHIKSGGVLEFRIFQSTTKPETIWRYCLIVWAVLQWVRETPHCVDLKQFARWVISNRSLTMRELVEHLKKPEFVVKDSPGRIINSWI